MIGLGRPMRSVAWAGEGTSSSAGSGRSKRARIVALCDADQAHLDREVKAARDHEEKVAAYTDFRKILDDKTIDAVVIALPNHWHAPATIWACQAGKDVVRREAVLVRHLGKDSRWWRAGLQVRPHGPGRYPEPFEHVPRGVFGPPEGGRAWGHPFCPRAGVSGLKWHRVSRGGPGAAEHGGLRPLRGPAPKKPLGRKQLHYDLALGLGDGQRRG